MQKYEKLEKIGEGIPSTFTAFCAWIHLECRFTKFPFAISLRGKCIQFIVITFCRYLWNRFQSKTQRNARDSGAEASKAWRRRWGKLFRMLKVVFCAFLAPTVITRGNPMCPFYYLLVRWAYQEMLMLFVRLETVS